MIATVRKSFQAKLYYAVGGMNPLGALAANGVTSGSPTITQSTTTGLTVGQFVTGAGIPADSYIISIIPSTSFTINAAATATDANESLTFGVSWTEYKGVKAVTLSATVDKDDTTVRQMNGIKTSEPTVVGYKLDFSVPYDETDVDRVAFVTAALANSVIGIACLTNAITVSTAQGLEADMKVYDYTIDQDIAKAQGQKFSLEPCISVNTPVFPNVA